MRDRLADKKEKDMRETEFIAHKKMNDRETKIDRAKMAEVSKIITEARRSIKWRKVRPRCQKKREKLLLPFEEKVKS